MRILKQSTLKATFKIILLIVLNKPMRMEEVFLIAQIQTIWMSGDKDSAIQRDIIIHVHLFFSHLYFFSHPSVI